MFFTSSLFGKHNLNNNRSWQFYTYARNLRYTKIHRMLHDQITMLVFINHIFPPTFKILKYELCIFNVIINFKEFDYFHESVMSLFHIYFAIVAIVEKAKMCFSREHISLSVTSFAFHKLLTDSEFHNTLRKGRSLKIFKTLRILKSMATIFALMPFFNITIACMCTCPTVKSAMMTVLSLIFFETLYAEIWCAIKSS